METSDQYSPKRRVSYSSVMGTTLRKVKKKVLTWKEALGLVEVMREQFGNFEMMNCHSCYKLRWWIVGGQILVDLINE